MTVSDMYRYMWEISTDDNYTAHFETTWKQRNNEFHSFLLSVWYVLSIDMRAAVYSLWKYGIYEKTLRILFIGTGTVNFCIIDH